MVAPNLKLKSMNEVMKSMNENGNREAIAPSYRFDIFKGKQGEDGKVTRLRSIGSAYLKEGMRTHMVVLKTFLDVRFYLIPNTKPDSECDYVILTRELAQNLKRKYFWNKVGEGKALPGMNSGIVKLTWDVLADDLYMNLHPLSTTEMPEESELHAA